MVNNLHSVKQHVRSGIDIPAMAVLFHRLSLTGCAHKAVLWGRERKKDMPCHQREDAKGIQKATSKSRYCRTQTKTPKNKQTSQSTSQTRGRKMRTHKD